jgi:hypothetical protein
MRGLRGQLGPSYLPEPDDLSALATFDVIDINRRSHKSLLQGRWDAYNGNLGDALKVRSGSPNDNVYLNFCKLVVDKSVHFLFGDKLNYDLDSESPERNDKEAYLDDVFRYNNLPVLLQRWATNGGVCGHAFIKIVVQQDTPYPRLLVLDPGSVTVCTRPDDHAAVTAYEIHWQVKTNQKTEKHKQVIAAGEWFLDGTTSADKFTAKYWTIVHLVLDNSGGNATWKLTEDEVILWDFPFPPIVDCQNLPAPNDYWGASDLFDSVIAVQRSINRVSSNINRILRLHAHPKTWVNGMTKQQLATLPADPDGIIALPNPDAFLRNLEMQSDLSSSLAFLRQLREAFHEMTLVPEVTAGRSEAVGSLSGAALKILYGPIVEKTNSKRNTYGEAFIDLCWIILALNNMAGTTLMDDTSRVRLGWPDLIPSDPSMESQLIIVDQRIGVSNATLMRKRGYDPISEEARRKKEEPIVLPVAAAAPADSSSNKTFPNRVPTPTPAKQQDN